MLKLKKIFEWVKKTRNFICETECHDIIVASSFGFILCGTTCMFLTWWIKGASLDISAWSARTDTVMRIIQIITSINIIIFNGVRLLKLNYDRNRNTPVTDDINGNLETQQIQLPADELNNHPTNSLTISYNVRINSNHINEQHEEQHNQNNNIFSKIRGLCYRCG